MSNPDIMREQYSENNWLEDLYSESESERTIIVAKTSLKTFDQFCKYQKLTRIEMIERYQKWSKPDKVSEMKSMQTESIFDVLLTWIDKTINLYIKNPRHRLDIPTVHGMRFNTLLKSNKDINSNLIEMMMGHSLKNQLDESYLKVTKEKLFLECEKGIVDITVF